MDSLLTSQQGLSLIEVIIAVTILAFIVLGVGTVTDQSIKTIQTVVLDNREGLKIEMAFQRFSKDFSKIYSPLYFSSLKKKPDLSLEAFSKYDGNERFPKESDLEAPIPEIYFEDKNKFEFFTATNRRKWSESKESHFAWVRYQLEPKKNKEEKEEGKNKGGSMEWVRYYLPKNIYKSEREDILKAPRHILLENVQKINFEFWHPEKGEFVENITDIPNGKLKLDGVKITLTWVSDEGYEETFTRVFRHSWPTFNPKEFEKKSKKITNTSSGHPSSQNKGQNLEKGASP